MSAAEIRIERARSRKFPGAERHWRGEELIKAHCTTCQQLKAAADLVTDRAKPGGRALQCLACNRERAAAYAATPTGKAKQHEHARRRVESGRNADQQRRYRAADPEKHREQARALAARRAARSDAEIAADQQRLRPNGLKKCRAGHWSPLDDFNADRTKADALQSYCREHHAENRAAQRLRPYADSWEERGLYACYICGGPWEHADHKWPLARDGADLAENLAPACAACNLSKNDAELFAWRPDLAALVAAWPVEIRQLSAV